MSGLKQKKLVHLHNGIVCSCKRKELLLFATVWMDLEIIMLSEIRQRKTNTIWSHLNGEPNEQNKLKNKIVSWTSLGFLRTVHLHSLVKGFGQPGRNDKDCMCSLTAFLLSLIKAIIYVCIWTLFSHFLYSENGSRVPKMKMLLAFVVST